MFLLFLIRHWISDRCETCQVIDIWLNFITQVQKFGEPSHKKSGAKDLPNLGRFYTTSDFDRECLRNESRYPKSERYIIQNDSSRVRRNKSGEPWSTIHKVVHVSLDPSKSTSSGHYISAPRRCWPLKFLNELDIGQGLLAHTTNHVGGPSQNFKAEQLKLVFKISKRVPITLGVVGITS